MWQIHLSKKRLPVKIFTSKWTDLARSTQEKQQQILQWQSWHQHHWVTATFLTRISSCHCTHVRHNTFIIICRTRHRPCSYHAEDHHYHYRNAKYQRKQEWISPPTCHSQQTSTQRKNTLNLAIDMTAFESQYNKNLTKFLGDIQAEGKTWTKSHLLLLNSSFVLQVLQASLIQCYKWCMETNCLKTSHTEKAMQWHAINK